MEGIILSLVSSKLASAKVLLINSITANGYTDILLDDAVLLFFLFCFPPQKESALKRKNLLLDEQILSLKSGPHLE